MTILGKKQMSEEDIKLNYITPVILKGWKGHICIPYAGMYNKYLFYYLMSMRQTYIGMAEGGAQPNISKEKIVNSILPLPPLEEQHRIVAKLEEILPLCERLK